jgi:hypothetical protein
MTVFSKIFKSEFELLTKAENVEFIEYIKGKILVKGKKERTKQNWHTTVTSNDTYNLQNFPPEMGVSYNR